MTEIRWHGRGGLGAFTAARLLGCAVSLFEGKYALACPSFGPERRGAPVFAFTRIDDKAITDRSEVVSCDCAVVLDDTLFGDPVKNGLKPGATVIVNTTKDKSQFAIDGVQVVTEFMPISARFIANKASYQFKHAEMDTMLEKLRAELQNKEEAK